MEPIFLTRDQVEAIHEYQVRTFGGLTGIRDWNAVESAAVQPLNVRYYTGGDLFDIAAACAFYIAESQAFFDGNKRTGMQAALDFLEINGVETDLVPEAAAHEIMIRLAAHELDRFGLASFFRSLRE